MLPTTPSKTSSLTCSRVLRIRGYIHLQSNSPRKTQTLILKKVPEIETISILMPNKHYFPYDFSKFPIPGIQGPGSGDVCLPVDKPSGTIQSTVARAPRAKL